MNPFLKLNKQYIGGSWRDGASCRRVTVAVIAQLPARREKEGDCLVQKLRVGRIAGCARGVSPE